MSTVFDALQRQFTTVEETLKLAQYQVEQEKGRVLSLLRESALSDVDHDALVRFMQKPYVLRPVKKDVWELIIPKFINFSAGWPVRVDGEYAVYQVSRFIDLITPMPDWLRNELGFKAPDFGVHREGDYLVVDEGNPDDVYEKLGRSKHISRRDGRKFKIAPRSQFEILRQLVRLGVLPYAPKPIPRDLLRVPETKYELRPKQARDFETFMKYSAVSVFASGGAGKTFYGMWALASLKGKKVILSPKTSILQQWQARIQTYLAPYVEGEVELRTYQSLSRHPLKGPYSLVIFEEVQHMPADMGMRGSQIDSVTRIGLSATPWREDGNEDIIPALCGVPVGMDWESGEPADTTIWITDDLAEKIKMVKRLTQETTRAKTMIFVYRLDVGKRIASTLGVPFISGATRDQYRQIQNADTFVISKVGDAGISVDVSRVIEVDWLGGRAEMGQRALRTRHANEKGELHILMTPYEYKDNAKRLIALYALSFDVKVKGA